jgi:hypothetical protein
MIATIPFTPHGAQAAIVASPARYRDCACGRRFGKTLLLSAEIIRDAVSASNRRVWVVAPIFKQTAEAWDASEYSIIPMLAAMERLNSVKVVADYSKSERRAKLLNGSTIEARTGESDENLRGAGLDFLGIDEAGQLRESAWQTLRPCLSDNRGRALRVGTPRGKNWWYREWIKGREHTAERASFHAPSNARPSFDPKEWEAAKSELPLDWFRQEYQADFLESQAAVFHGLDACLVGGAGQDPKPQTRYAHGLDIAKQQDWSVLVTIDLTARRLVSLRRMQRVEYIHQAEAFSVIIRRYPGPVWADATGVGPALIDPLRLRGVEVHGYTFTEQSKRDLVGNLIQCLEAKTLLIPTEGDFAQLVSELRDFEYKLSGTGQPKYGAPDGLTDDCVFGLALAAWGANRGGANVVRENRYSLSEALAARGR